ncbi:hypothetical protein ABZ319_30440 [Nocardia sp. NPDC005978]|uniref:hypothetical protein n=1 Tax=Nocardia sp. NPDC005978 TaxID=3156725 RepID=UPI0033A8B0BF
MYVSRVVLTVLALGVVVAATACGTTDPPSSDGTTSVTVTETAPSSPPGSDAPTTPGAPGAPATSSLTVSKTTGPPGGQPTTPANGAVAIRTATLTDVAIPYVPVHLRLYRPCDPATHDLPEGTPESQRWDAVTDINGQAVFSVPVGCYRFGMDAPAGTNPVPEGLHTLFVETAGQVVNGRLRFQDPAPQPLCASQTIVHDLAVEDALKKATPTVTDCDGFWAVISWNVPGDSQRIVHRGADFGWKNYVTFPHKVCLDKAKTDGVPAPLHKYFQPC